MKCLYKSFYCQSKSKNKMARNADEVIESTKLINLQLFNLFSNLEDSYEFKSDHTCLRDGLSNYNLIIKHQKCYSCRLLDLLFKNDTIEDKIKILVGKYKHKVINIKKTNKDIFKIVYLENLNDYLKIYNRDICNYYTLEKHFSYTKFFGSTNKKLNLAIINNILKNYSKNNNYLYHYICNNKLIYLDYNYDIDNLEELLTESDYGSKEMVKKILYSIVIYYKFFSNYYYTHNEPCIEFLKFNLDIVNIKTEDKNITMPFKTYILPSEYSSITLFKKDKAKRYFYQGGIDKNISDLPFEDFDISFNGSKNYNKKTYDIEYCEDYNSKRIFFYKIGNRAKDFLDLRRYSGIPLASKSFDIIVFYASLLLEKNYYGYYLQNYTLITIWKGLWKVEEYPLIMRELDILRNKNINKFDNIYNVIKKYYLRFDALEYLYVSLSTSW